MKKFALILFLSAVCVAANATHIINGNIYYKYKNTVNNIDFYDVSIVLYRDCDASTVGFDSTIFMAVYNKDNSTITGNTIAVALASDVAAKPIVLPSGAASAVGCYHKGTYTTTISVTPNTEGYFLLWQRCCLRPGTNFIDDNGISCLAYIPGNSLKNNMCASPTLETSVILGANQYAELLLANTDDDGDSLSYQLAHPYAGASVSTPIVENYPSIMATPLPLISYRNGYSAQQPFATGSVFNLDNKTGTVTLYTPNTGLFILGIDIIEWRNGVKINTSRREFVVLVLATGKANGVDLVAKPAGSKKINIAWNFTTLDIVRKQFLLRKTQGASTWDTIARPVVTELTYTDSVGLNYDSTYQYMLKVETPNWPLFSAIDDAKLDSNTTKLPMVAQSTLLVYPNPATNKLFIELPENYNSPKIIITDVLGRNSMQFDADNINAGVDIEALPQGFYVLTVISNKNTLTTKFYKQ
jgi:hypothetical protein